jgi:hypothetical protein
MAITIHQEPNAHSAISTPLIIVASSTNSGNEGFSYGVKVTANGIATDFVVQPNPNGYLIFDFREPAKTFIRNVPMPFGIADENISIHSARSQFYPNILEASNGYYKYNGLVTFNVTIKEGYLIDGVFTLVDDTEVLSSTVVYNFTNFGINSGYNPQLLPLIDHSNGDQSYLMSDRLHSTHQFYLDAAYGLNLDNTVYIPTYETDWGVFTIRQYDGTSIADNAKKVKLSILPNTGPPVSFTIDMAYEETFSHLGLYPANLNTSTIDGILKPQDYPNWKAIYFQILNDDDEQVSVTYIMYNAQRANMCYGDQTKIRLAWVGRRGGWEYFNFCQNSFDEYVTEKKIAYRVIGNYGDVASGTPFAFNTFDESEIVTDMAVQKFVNASSDWVQDGEREFLKGLFLSKQVHWVQDDGSHIPVIVQSDGYQVKKVYGSGPLFKLDIKVKIAQEQFN